MSIIDYRGKILDVKKKRRDLLDYIWVFLVFLIILMLISLVAGFAVVEGGGKIPQWATSDHPMMVARDLTISPDTWFSKIFINNWYRFDTGWYLKISAMGYDKYDNSIGFQPFYPLAIRFVKSILGASYLQSALLISRISCLVSSLLLYRIASEQFKSKDVAKKSIILFLTFPSSFFLFSGYAEALFLALTLSAWILFAQKRWFFAGLLGGLSSLIRIQGFLLSVPLLWISITNFIEIYVQNFNHVLLNSVHKLLNKRGVISNIILSVIAALMPALTIGVYSIFLKTTGMNSITQEYENWGNFVVWPWVGLFKLLERTLSGNFNFVDYIDIILFIIFIIGLFLIHKKLPIPYLLYTLSILFLILMIGRESNFLPGFMRYMLVIFPVFLAFGEFIKNPKVFYLIITLMMSVNLFLLWLFINWFWIA